MALFHRSRYHEWCIWRCLEHYAVIAPIVEKFCKDKLPCCVVTSIALFEIGARSPFERWIERTVYRTGDVLARVGLLPGVPDVSVGPFQIRPSTAFGWRRRQVPFGHVAVPGGECRAAGPSRAADLCEPVTAMPLLIDLLAGMSNGSTSCRALVGIYSRYRGCALTPSETDYHVLMGVHAALHSYARAAPTGGSGRRGSCNRGSPR